MTIRTAFCALALAGGIAALLGCSAPAIPREWSTWESVGTPSVATPVPGHQEPYRIAYINPTGEAAKPTVRNGAVAWDYPEGTVILKAGYAGSAPPGKGESPTKLYAMIKKPADPRARGGWMWVVGDVRSGTESVIDAPYCVDCHGYANQPNPYGDKNPDAQFRDYVYHPYTPDVEGK
jgi:hypothetical protein